VKPVAFEYCRADTREEALELLAEFGPDASVLAGGLSLGAMLNMRLVRPKAVIDVNRVPGLDAIRTHDGTIETGALLRQALAMRSAELMEAVPLLREALPHVGHYQTRSRGTFGGSVAHADPSAEIPLALVTLGGSVELEKRGQRRKVPARAFFMGILSTAREADELVTALVWPRRGPGSGFAFVELSQRLGDFAITAAAAAVTLAPDGRVAELSLGLGGVEDRPIVADTRAAEDAHPTAETARSIAEAAAAAVDPMTDVQAEPEYRRQLVRVLGARAIETAFRRARGEA
jgi:2-furoyl-CoA dehydrogenase FAD binding subunit